MIQLAVLISLMNNNAEFIFNSSDTLAPASETKINTSYGKYNPPEGDSIEPQFSGNKKPRSLWKLQIS